MIYNWVQDHVEVYPDHIMVNGTVPIMRTDYFTQRLSNLDDFDGFAPRWIFPQTRMVLPGDISHTHVATQTMLIIDTKREIKIGVGLNSWPNMILNRGEM